MTAMMHGASKGTLETLVERTKLKLTEHTNNKVQDMYRKHGGGEKGSGGERERREREREGEGERDVCIQLVFFSLYYSKTLSFTPLCCRDIVC